jgi:hypothetical protein
MRHPEFAKLEKDEEGFSRKPGRTLFGSGERGEMRDEREAVRLV